MPKTATIPRPPQANGSAADKREEAIRKRFPVKENQFLRISNVWDNFFRINLYEVVNSGYSMMSDQRIVESHFVQVTGRRRFRVKVIE